MPAAPADSAVYRRLFGDEEVAALFTDSAEIRAMLLVEGVLARVQGRLGLIPQDAAALIDRASREVQIDPAGLAAQVARDGVPVPALRAAFRAAVPGDAMGWAHWGATSQDIADTGLALRLRRVLAIWEGRLAALTAALGRLAEEQAELPMAARTYGQVATRTSFGAVAAGWGWPLLEARDGLEALRPRLLRVSLGGAAGTLSAMGPRGPEVRAGVAAELGLADPGHGWHPDRSGIAALAGWAAGLAGTLGRMGEDMILMTQSGIGELRLPQAGGSSTMPQKQNPVGPSALVALSRQIIGLAATLQGAGLHRQQRDGAAWFQEWLTLPQLCLSTGRALSLAAELTEGAQPVAEAMAAALADGFADAEALSFALAETMPRDAAQAAVRRLAVEAAATGTPLTTLADRDHPIPGGWAARLGGAQALGTAPEEARAFAAAAAANGLSLRSGSPGSR
ncbi:adenylosuccinate lyase family protein [Paracoccus sp. S-4012]|uniref:lyase family protein n=1 Tax=Paracoccus sp. S-4012 TaxID=2665648 RepID=UPI0012B0410A|nr:lyase family protein [Paracoccus sp. S-4012]MRX50224.1 adenylosuccinate lyase family protein [Paracoccus sp. S-4012]